MLGRRIGPVLQSIGTQTVWQRDISIGATFDVTRKEFCTTSTNQIVGIQNETLCLASSSRGANNRWVENPNHTDIGDFIGSPEGGVRTNLMTLAKPGDKNVLSSPGAADGTKLHSRRIQAKGIAHYIESFDPKWSLQSKDSSGVTTSNVRKSFFNPPQESWNPKTGEWSYTLSWVYELNDPWGFPSTDYVDPNVAEGTQDDGFDQPYPGQDT